jgi:hypothetical protein
MMQIPGAPGDTDERGLHSVYCTGQPMSPLEFGTASPLFLEDEDIFQKSGSMVPLLLRFRVVPWSPIFEWHL